MFLYIILLSSGLDMSLPEFEPTTDISGNYVYTEYDFEVEDIVVEELADLPDGLTVEEPQDGYVYDEFIEEEPLEVSPVIRSSIDYSYLDVYQRTIKFNYSNDTIGSGSDLTIKYVALQPNVEYRFFTNANRVLICDNFNNGTQCTQIDEYSQSYSFTTAKYAFVALSKDFAVSYVDSIGDDPSGNDPSGGGYGTPYDDTELLLKLDHIDILLRSILFVSIWRFALPLAMKIRDHIFGLKHE